ncbi:MAG TPA: CHASE3 domain-containing protein, partial [Candidatus Acidoferrales bacterium]|nr:CHASE3 domain-containing protein [Candidatus Acidoferrales bacterium]
MTPLRRWSISWRVTLIFVSALCLLIVAALSARWQLTESFQTSNWIRRSNQVLDQSERVLSDLLDSETGQRGYLLTGKMEYLEPYQQGSQSANRDIEKLGMLVQGDSDQSERVKRIAALTRAKLDEIEATIQLRKAQGAAAALDLVASDSGKKSMDELRRLIADFQNEERRLLEERTAQQFGRRNLLSKLVAALGAGAVFLLIAELLFLNA